MAKGSCGRGELNSLKPKRDGPKTFPSGIDGNTEFFVQFRLEPRPSRGNTLTWDVVDLSEELASTKEFRRSERASKAPQPLMNAVAESTVAKKKAVAAAAAVSQKLPRGRKRKQQHKQQQQQQQQQDSDDSENSNEDTSGSEEGEDSDDDMPIKKLRKGRVDKPKRQQLKTGKRKEQATVAAAQAKAEAERKLKKQIAVPAVFVKVSQVGMRLLVRDDKRPEVTYNAHVIQVDEQKQRIKIHYDGWNVRYDHWLAANWLNLALIPPETAAAKKTPARHSVKQQRQPQTRRGNGSVAGSGSRGSSRLGGGRGGTKTASSINDDDGGGELEALPLAMRREGRIRNQAAHYQPGEAQVRRFRTIAVECSCH